MNHKEQNRKWTRQRIEAMADGSLERGERRRMRAAMRGDPQLRSAVERARALRGGLKRLGAAPVPAGLAARLLAVPGGRARRWPLIALPAAAAAAVAAVTLVLLTQPPETAPEDPAVAAIRDFNIAMTYLQRSAAYTGEEIGGIVSAGLLEALTVSRNSLTREEPDDENGG
jgi:anti-sigma factor RsiW